MKTKYYDFGGHCFCGNQISSYGLQYGYVDYRALARSFDAVLNNKIFHETGGFDAWELYNGGEVDNSEEIAEVQNRIDELTEKLDRLNSTDYEDEREYEDRYEELTEQIRILEDEIYDLENESFWDHDCECYQEFIISEQGAKILADYTDEVVWYNEDFDLYLWDINHYGAGWDYVLTGIKIYTANDYEQDYAKPETDADADELPFC